MIIHGDNLNLMQALGADSVDLVFTSPPYEAARTYGIDFTLRGQDWVDWAFARFVECVRVCRGLVAWVVEGQTRKYQYSAAPLLLAADLHRAGIKLRKPPIFYRVGIPGSGGPDWLRNDYEFIICSSKGKLPWSENTAMGHPPKWAPGGEMSYRLADGSRRNEWGGTGHLTGMEGRTTDGDFKTRKRKGVNQWGHPINSGGMITEKGGKHRSKGRRPSHKTQEEMAYAPPVLANPGNVIKCKVGGGLMGSQLAHENEAPFPERLAEFFIRSFCPPGGIVLDPHSGSGTTCAVAQRLGRDFIGMDIRESQVELTKRRLAETQSRQQELL